MCIFLSQLGPQKPQKPSGGRKNRLTTIPNQLAMKPLKTTRKRRKFGEMAFSTTFWLLLMFIVSASAENSCHGEPRCTCKWLGGRNTADCSNAGLTSIPTTLDSKYQVLIMDNNPIEKLQKDVFKVINQSINQSKSLSFNK